MQKYSVRQFRARVQNLEEKIVQSQISVSSQEFREFKHTTFVIPLTYPMKLAMIPPKCKSLKRLKIQTRINLSPFSGKKRNNKTGYLECA